MKIFVAGRTIGTQTKISVFSFLKIVIRNEFSLMAILAISI
jgi:hypothetical protein